MPIMSGVIKIFLPFSTALYCKIVYAIQGVFINLYLFLENQLHCHEDDES